MNDLVVPEIGTKYPMLRIAGKKINIIETQAFLLYLINQFSIGIKSF